MITLGVLSDTHGELHPRAVPLFREAGVERILHAGDVGGYGVISALTAVAPVVAVRGNIDTTGQAASLPAEVTVEVEGIAILMTHIGAKPYLWLPRLPHPRPHIAICGHSHVPLCEEAENVLFLNPGAAGTKRRFNRPLTAALLHISASSDEVQGRSPAEGVMGAGGIPQLFFFYYHPPGSAQIRVTAELSEL